MTGILPGDIWLRGKFVPLPAGWSDYRVSMNPDGMIHQESDGSQMAMNVKELIGIGQVEVVGLDIGRSAVKMVQLDRDGDQYCVVTAAMQEIERSDDPAKHQNNTAAAIRRCFSQSGRTTRNVVCGVGGPDVMVRSFSFPNLPPEAIGQAVMLEAQQVCPLDIQSSVVDYQLVDSPGAQAGPIAASLSSPPMRPFSTRTAWDTWPPSIPSGWMLRAWP